MKSTIYAVEHGLGLSLIRASSPESALKIAEKRYGTHAGPYTLPDDQEYQIAYAKSMGAGVY